MKEMRCGKRDENTIAHIWSATTDHIRQEVEGTRSALRGSTISAAIRRVVLSSGPVP